MTGKRQTRNAVSMESPFMSTSAQIACRLSLPVATIAHPRCTSRRAPSDGTDRRLQALRPPSQRRQQERQAN